MMKTTSAHKNRKLNEVKIYDKIPAHLKSIPGSSTADS